MCHPVHCCRNNLNMLHSCFREKMPAPMTTTPPPPHVSRVCKDCTAASGGGLNYRTYYMRSFSAIWREWRAIYTMFAADTAAVTLAKVGTGAEFGDSSRRWRWDCRRKADSPRSALSQVMTQVRFYLDFMTHLQPADIGWPTGNGKKVSNSQACCLAQLCLAAA